MTRDEAGQVAGVEVLPFGVLVFVVGALLIASVWGAFDARTTAAAAAREAIRAYVEARSATAGDAAAHAAALDVVEAIGRDRQRMQLEVHVDGNFGRCARIMAEARYPIAFLRLPWIGGLGPGMTVIGRHSEIVDPFRSDVPGEAACGSQY